MRKTRMISVIAASLLTATVIFTGCGGGGSSVSSSSSSSSVSSSSSSSAPAVKTVKVSDGYVLQASVTCGSNTAVATANAGEYEFATADCPANIVAANGYNDVNGNGQVDVGEPKAPTMAAPASFTNVNPYTTLLAHGMSADEVAAAVGLPADTDFDVAIPEASDSVKIKAYELALALSAVQSRQEVNSRGAFDGIGGGAATSSTSSSSSSSEASSSSQVTSGGGAFAGIGGGAATSSTSSSSSSSEASSSSETSSSSGETIDSMDKLIAAFKGGKSLGDVLAILDLGNAASEIEGAASASEAEAKAAAYMKNMIGFYTEGNGESSSEPSSETGSSSSECVDIPGVNNPCKVSSSQESTSSSENTSSSTSTSSSQASESSSISNNNQSGNTGGGAFTGIS